MLADLRHKIAQVRANIAVIGLGYVGLPVACEFARVGFNVLGLDIIHQKVDRINAGISPIEGSEPGLAELLMDVNSSRRFRASTDYGDLRDRDIILICVETPIDDGKCPNYDALVSSLRSLAPNMKRGSLIIIESTIAPGTMKNVVKPVLEENSSYKMNIDFFLGNCPERVMPGKLLANIRSVSRVVGGMTPATAEAMVLLYEHIVSAELDPVDSITAELVKTVENTYRDVQIAFANEVAMICEAVGGDVWQVRELVNKSPGRNMLYPGSGVGGHCIPKDPWLLASSASEADIALHVIPAARAVNNSMPFHMLQLLEMSLKSIGKKVDRSRVLILGYAYLEESDDSRNSPSRVLVDQLELLGAQVIIHDPYINDYKGFVLELANDCDAIVLMVKHREYKNLSLPGLKLIMRTPLLIDGRGFFNKDEVEKAGIIYSGVGIASRLP